MIQGMTCDLGTECSGVVTIAEVGYDSIGDGDIIRWSRVSRFHSNIRCLRRLCQIPVQAL